MNEVLGVRDEVHAAIRFRKASCVPFFLVRGEQFSFVFPVRIGFGSSEKTLAHHNAICAYAERCCQASRVRNPTGGED